MINWNPPLNYSNVDEIYSSIEPMTVPYNNAEESTELMSNIFTTFGPSVFNETTDGEEAMLTESETYTDYFKRVGDHLYDQRSS